LKVRVLYFAALRERAGQPTGQEETVPGTTAGALWAAIQSRPAFTGVRYSPGFAVNGTWTSAERVLEDGDELALLPPVSGG
jgi:molybdopterin converting factor subunit 1